MTKDPAFKTKAKCGVVRSPYLTRSRQATGTFEESEDLRVRADEELVEMEDLFRELTETMRGMKLEIQELGRAREGGAEERGRSFGEEEGRDVGRIERSIKRLPTMGPNDDLEGFVVSMEAALTSQRIPDEEWKALLLARLTQKARSLASDLEKNRAATFAEVKARLLLSGGLSVPLAGDSFFVIKPEERSISEVSTFVQYLSRRADKILEDATDLRIAKERMIVARVRALVCPTAREFLMTRMVVSLEDLRTALTQWVAIKGSLSSLFGTGKGAEPGKTAFSASKCFTCGKPGHRAAQCWSKSSGAVKEEAQPTGRSQKPFDCFTCGQPGHRAVDCPTRAKSDQSVGNKKKLKRVRQRWKKRSDSVVKYLKSNEMVASVNGVDFPITLDTGADVTIIPRECVREDQLTGDKMSTHAAFGGEQELDLAKVRLRVGSYDKECEVAVAEGRLLGWSGLFSIKLESEEELELLSNLSTERLLLEGKDLEYVLPFKGLCELVDKQSGSSVLISESGIDEPKAGEDHLEFAHLVEAWEPPKLNGSVEGVTPEHVDALRVCKVNKSDKSGGSEDIKVLTKEDMSLITMRELADKGLEGYSWKDGILVRERMNDLGKIITQICVPEKLRKRVMSVAHDKCGHPSKGKVVEAVKRCFHWPGMWSDIAAFCRSCPTCQKVSKASPRKAPMVVRETVSVPFESVAVDIVGPMPKGRGGAEYILTYIDQATRWPEAVPLRKITARSVITGLEGIFGRNGFPLKILTDNGSQFVCKEFEAFCEKAGIAHSVSAPYHPQTNGVVERFHGTLGPMLTKLCEGHKGRWPDLLAECMYFIRLLPNSSTGYSPFEAVHGFQPVGPVELLSNGWLKKNLGESDIAEWIGNNMDAIESVREKMCAKQSSVSGKREEGLNKNARMRVLEVGEKVLMRVPGMEGKLVEAWEGPYVVMGKCSVVSYKIDVGRSKPRVAHINSLKRWKERDVCVKRISTVVAEDVEGDVIDEGVKSLVVKGRVDEAGKLRDIERWCEDFRDVITDEPGTVVGVEFGIDTGDCLPICQSPYATPVGLREKVNQELDWLLERGFIRPSSSEWSSPMVTVRKPNGKVRLCVDFKRVNAVTRPQTFYMPTVDEMIEAVGDAKFISKLDLTKGYYQFPMEEDSISKTAFICHRGKYEFVRMPFGVRNAPAAFQSFMTRTLDPAKDCSACYIDDIVVHSGSWGEHVKDVRRVLELLRGAGLSVNPAKCEWGGTEVEFLGHRIGNGMCGIPESRGKAVRDFARPRTKKGLRSFLGLVSYYRRFVKALARYTAVLSPATEKAAPPVIEWTEAMVKAFKDIRELLGSAVCLCVPLPDDIVSVVSDASGLGVGGVLQVQRDGEWRPAAYFSRQTKGAERRYSASELEALALVESVHHFGHHLYGKRFVAYTDHKALCSLLSSQKLNPRLRRMAMKLQPWLIEIQYLPGECNGLADALSRQEWPRDVMALEGGSAYDRGVELPEGHTSAHVAMETASRSGCSLVAGDVVATPPRCVEEGTGRRQGTSSTGRRQGT